MKRDPPKPVYKQPWKTKKVKPWCWTYCSKCQKEFKRESGWQVSRRYFRKISTEFGTEEVFYYGNIDIFCFCAECLETEQAVNRLFAEKYEKQYIF